MFGRMDRQAIFARIEQYEKDFRKNPSGRSMPKLLHVFAEDELDVFGFMGMNHVTVSCLGQRPLGPNLPDEEPFINQQNN